METTNEELEQLVVQHTATIESLRAAEAAAAREHARLQRDAADSGRNATKLVRIYCTMTFHSLPYIPNFLFFSYE